MFSVCSYLLVYLYHLPALFCFGIILQTSADITDVQTRKSILFRKALKCHDPISQEGGIKWALMHSDG